MSLLRKSQTLSVRLSARFSSTSTTTPHPNQNDAVAIPSLEPSNDADTLSNVLLTHHNPFHSTETSLQLLHGVTLTPHLLTQILLRLRHHSKISLSLFHHSKSLPNPPLSLPSYNLLIDTMSKVRQFDVAWQLLADMDHHNIPPTPSTFLILIRRLVSAGLTRQAIRAFHDIRTFSSSAAVSADHFRLLLDTLCKYGHAKLAVEVFNRNKQSFVPDVKIYTTLIYGWCKLGRIIAAKAMFCEMVERGIEPNVVTYNVLLNGICRRASLHPEERFERVIRDAEEVFVEMRQRGIEPDVTSFSTVLHVYSRAHKPQLSLDKLRLMKERGLCPTMATYTSVIKCLCSCGWLEDAEALLGEMVENGVNPCAATYNCFFKEYRGRKDAESALKLFRRIKGDGLCSLTPHTYGILLRMFLQLNKIGVVEEMWNDMKETGVGPDLDLYTVLIHGLCKKKRWREACHFFVEMIENGFLPQKVTFETLYSGLIQADMLRTWRRLKKKLDEESITFGSEFKNYQLKPYRRCAARILMQLAPPDSGAYVALSNMYASASAGDWDAVAEVRLMMKDLDIRKEPGCSWIEIGGVIREFLVEDDSHPRTREMHSMLEETSNKLNLEGYRPDATQVLLNMDEKHNESVLHYHREKIAVALSLA